MSKNIIAEAMITGPISKMIELPGAYVINAHVYDKINTAPVPQSFFPHLASAACESVIKQMSKVSSGWCGLKTEKSFIQDKKDPNIVYLLSNMSVNGNSTTPQFYKIKKNGYKFSTMGKVVNLLAVANVCDFDIIDDDADNVYVSVRGNNEYFSILKVNKETLVVTELNLQAAGTANRILHTVYNKIVNGMLYVFNSGVTATSNAIKVINLTTFTATTYTQPSTMGFGGYMYSDIRVDNNILSVYFIGKTNELWRIQFNTLTNVITDSKVADIPVPLTINVASSPIHFLLNKNYILMASRNEHITPAGVAERDLVLFTIDENGDVIYKDYLDPEFQYTNFLFSKADDLIFVANKFRVDVISITESRMLQKQQSITPSYLNMIGRDTNGNIFFINDDTSGHVMNREIPIKINAKFEKEYEFKGNPIVSYIEISMETHLGYKVSGKVRMDLNGAAVFADGTQSKEVDISGLTQVPIIVVSYGDISVNVVNI